MNKTILATLGLALWWGGTTTRANSETEESTLRTAEPEKTFMRSGSEKGEPSGCSNCQ